MRVVVDDVLAQHRLELPARHDQDPVETFATDAADPVGMGGDAGEIHTTPGQLDEKEHIEPAQPDRLDREEVTLEDCRRLLAQELPPAHTRAFGCGLDAVTLEHVPDATRREPDPEPDEFAVDALVPPTRVLRRQTQDHLSRLCEQRRPARPSTLIRPAAADEVTMPAQKRRRLDQERARPRQQPAECSQQDTIGRPQTRPTYLAPQHLQLMPQHQDLHFLRPLRTTKQNQQLEQTANDPVSEGQTLNQQTSTTHRPTLPARTTPGSSSLSTRARPSRTPNEFVGPTGRTSVG